MAASRIESRGFSISRWWFPAFSIGRGECITVRLPEGALADHDRIIACLRGAEPVAGLDLPAPVEIAEWAFPPNGWRRWFSDPTPFEWLKKNTTLSADLIQAFLCEHGMDRDIPLSRYAGTPRTLLGLAAAMAKNPEAVVFSTIGLDPLGRLAVQGVVAARLPEFIAVYLAWPYRHQSNIHHPEFPGSQVVTVLAKSEILASPPQLYG